ncbi:Prefoldin subunit 6 [Homalodisca vitripennis]|nr:Prefoldin subunit 6 [Homalodisca vitripennis]
MVQKVIARTVPDYWTCRIRARPDYRDCTVVNGQTQLSKLFGPRVDCLSSVGELDLMKGEGEVFKLIGPVLVKQELEEAKQNVAKRIDYISGELKRIDNNIAAMETKVEGHRERLSKLQTRLQQEQVKAALKE